MPRHACYALPGSGGTYDIKGMTIGEIATIAVTGAHILAGKCANDSDIQRDIDSLIKRIDGDA